MRINDRSKTDFDRAKIKLTGHFDLRPTGRYFEPCECYVDDSKLFLSFSLSELDNAVTKVNQDITLMFEWCCANYLLINV